MGMATAGIVLLENTSILKNKKILLRTIGESSSSIKVFRGKGKFDTRHKGDLYVADFESFSILHGSLVHSVLFNDSEDYKRIYKALKKPKFMLFFCCYESGGSYGYAIIENGTKVRSRVQMEIETTHEYGEPLDFERKWLNAERHYSDEDGEYFKIPGDCSEIRNSEYFTHDLLNDCFNHFLGFNPIYEGPQSNGIAYRVEPKKIHSGPLPENLIHRWNWGAFLCNWVWAIWHRQWVGLLSVLPYIGLAIAVYLGIKGNVRAWKSKSWESIEEFESHQKRWAIAGLLFWSALIVFTLI